MDSKNAPPAETPEGYYKLGYERLRARDLSGALDAFRTSIKINPAVASPWIGLAQVLDANGQHEDAHECLKRATAVDPTHIDSRLKLATSNKRLGHVDEAKRDYEHALRLNPKSAAAYAGLGHLMEELGEPAAAAQAYRAALKHDPSKSDSIANLLGLSRHIDVSTEIEQAHQLLATADNRVKALIGYGLGKAYEQKKEYAPAFDAYAIANKARREATSDFDRYAHDMRIEGMTKLFSKTFFERRRGWGIGSEQPVFIVGLPRSGTTLTEQIIASHPDCFGAGELHTLTDLTTGTPDRLGDATQPWPICAPALTQAHVKALAQDYLVQSRVRAPNNARRVVDKQPLNFWHLGMVAMALPNAKIIHCIRDIRDCGFSIYSQNFSLEQTWATDLGDIAHYWRGYRKLMDHWAEVTGLEILDVVYEDTVSDLEPQARRLLGFLDLPWDDRVLDFHENDRAVQTPSRWQVRQPLYQSSKARWRRYETQLTPLIEAAENPG